MTSYRLREIRRKFDEKFSVTLTQRLMVEKQYSVIKDKDKGWSNRASASTLLARPCELWTVLKIGYLRIKD